MWSTNVYSHNEFPAFAKCLQNFSSSRCFIKVKYSQNSSWIFRPGMFKPCKGHWLFAVKFITRIPEKPLNRLCYLCWLFRQFVCVCVMCVGCVTIIYDISHIDTTGIHHHWHSQFVHSILSASSSGCVVVTHRDQRQSYEGEWPLLTEPLSHNVCTIPVGLWWMMNYGEYMN